MNKRIIVWMVSAACLCSAGQAFGWHKKGHARITGLAVDLLGDDVPAVFRQQKALIVACSSDPDLFRLDPGIQVRTAEGPEHYIDMDLLEGAPLPETRREFMKLCGRLGKIPSDVGFLPYTVTEWTQRFAAVLAQYRSRPDDPHVRAKLAVYAGLLSHYAADLCMPLHVTVDFDGRVGPDGRSPRSGIHGRVDDLAGKVPATTSDVLTGIEAPEFTDLWKAVKAEVAASRRQIDTVYALDERIPAVGEPLPAEGDVYAFAKERLQRAVWMVAGVVLKAWEESATIELPEWAVEEPSEQ